MNLNVFAELDACFYIDQGYFSQKHLAAELHIYDAIAVHIKLMKFSRSQWNRLATDRDLLLCLKNTKDVHDGAEVTVRVTPEISTFVEVSELCTEDLSAIKLNYKNTWRNIGVGTINGLRQLKYLKIMNTILVLLDVLGSTSGDQFHVFVCHGCA